jgi:hypothetical protein
VASAASVAADISIGSVGDGSGRHSASTRRNSAASASTRPRGKTNEEGISVRVRSTTRTPCGGTSPSGTPVVVVTAPHCAHWIAIANNVAGWKPRTNVALPQEQARSAAPSPTKTGSAPT